MTKMKKEQNKSLNIKQIEKLRKVINCNRFLIQNKLNRLRRYCTEKIGIGT